MNRKAVISGNISLVFGVMIFLLLIIFAVMMNVKTTSVESDTRYTQVERASGAQGMIYYQPGWLTNAYLNSQLTIQQEEMLLSEALSRSEDIEEITPHLDALLSQTRIAAKSLLHIELFVIQDQELVYCQGKHHAQAQDWVQTRSYAQQTFCQRLSTRTNRLSELQQEQHDRPAQMSWTAIPGTSKAILGVVVS